MKQTFQTLTTVVEEDLKSKPENIDRQDYFYQLKQKDPQRYQRMMFDTNWCKPYSRDLEEIIFNLYCAGKYDPFK